MTVSEDKRILMVEFVNADQFPGRINYVYPLIQGFLEEKEIPSRWIRFGISTINLMKHGRDEITFSDEEFSKLFEIIEDFKPNHFWVTDEICEEQSEKISAVCPIDIIKIASEEIYDNPAIISPVLSREKPLNEDSCLNYSWEPGNRAAKNKVIDNVYLIIPKGCGHQLDYSENPCYKNIKDERVKERFGCAFCGMIKIESSERRKDYHKIIAKQVRDIARSRKKPENFPNAILLEQMYDEEFFWACVKTMQETGMGRYTKLLIAPRTDRLPILKRLVHEHFRTAGDQGPNIGVYASGVESFSQYELTLYNKGTKPLDGFRAFNIVRELKSTYEDKFSYTGLSFLFFSPWTTPENLHLNMGLFKHLRISRKEAGNVFQSRMRLHPHLAVTSLAEHDGLVIDKETDPTLIMNRRKLFKNEKPWNFADGRLKPLSRIVLRFDLFKEDDHDALTESIQEHFISIDPDWKGDEDNFLINYVLAMIDVIRKQKDVLDEEILLEQASDLIRERITLKPLRPNRFRVGEAKLTLLEFLENALETIKKDLRKIIWLEHVTKAELTSDIKQLLKENDFEVASFQTKKTRQAQETTLVICKDKSTLSRFFELQDCLNSDSEQKEKEKAAVELGKLFGYPECCAASFAENYLSQRRPLRWAFFEKRMKSPAAISHTMNPFIVPELSHIPCSIECERAEQTFRKIFETMKVDTDIVERNNYAHFFSFDEREDDCLSFKVIKHDQESLFYDPQTIKDDGRLRTSWLLKGNRIDILPGQIRIYAEQKLLDISTANHGIWFAEKSWYEEEWIELAHAAIEIRREFKPKTPAVEKQSLFTRWLQHILTKIDPVVADQTGFHIQEINPHVEKVDVTLKNKDFSFQIVLRKSSEKAQAFKRGEYLSASFVGSEMVDDRKQIPTLDFLLSILEKAASKTDIFNALSRS